MCLRLHDSDQPVTCPGWPCCRWWPWGVTHVALCLSLCLGQSGVPILGGWGQSRLSLFCRHFHIAVWRALPDHRRAGPGEGRVRGSGAICLQRERGSAPHCWLQKGTAGVSQTLLGETDLWWSWDVPPCSSPQSRRRSKRCCNRRQTGLHRLWRNVLHV